MCPRVRLCAIAFAAGICSRHGPALQHRHTPQQVQSEAAGSVLSLSLPRTSVARSSSSKRAHTYAQNADRQRSLNRMDQIWSARGCQPSPLSASRPQTFREGAAGAVTTHTEWPTPLSRPCARACGAAELGRRIRAAPLFHSPLQCLTYSIGMPASSSTSRADGVSFSNSMVPLRCPRAASFTGRGKGSPASQPPSVPTSQPPRSAPLLSRECGGR